MCLGLILMYLPGVVSLDDFLSFAFAVTFDTQTNLPADNFSFCSCIIQTCLIKIPVC
jgi:hypothetical protein